MTRLDFAMFENALPVNPIPFLSGLIDYVRENGTNSIQDDTAKRLLWVILSQAYGQLGTVDMTAEYQRLSESRRNTDG